MYQNIHPATFLIGPDIKFYLSLLSSFGKEKHTCMFSPLCVQFIQRTYKGSC